MIAARVAAKGNSCVTVTGTVLDTPEDIHVHASTLITAGGRRAGGGCAQKSRKAAMSHSPAGSTSSSSSPHRLRMNANDSAGLSRAAVRGA